LHISYEVYGQYTEMPAPDAELIRMAFEATKLSYAPYSGFHVGAIALMRNGEIVSGANQENASFPAGICAERVLLSTVSSLYPDEGIDTIAITHEFRGIPGDQPVAPCGICRQSLVEFEERMQQPLRILLGGLRGEVYVFDSAVSLLPWHFSGTMLDRKP